MCRSTLNIGNVGEMAALHRIALANNALYPNLVLPTITPFEGAPFDAGMVVNKQFFKLQIKTTEHASKNGKMSFLTCHSSTGKPYTDVEVDLFLLHCIDPEWYGLALPSECGRMTYIYKHPTIRQSSYQAEWFDFDKRLREIIETGSIKPFPYVVEDEKEEPENVVPVKTTMKKPDTWGELYNLLMEHNFDLEALSADIGVSIPTLQRWTEELTVEEAV